MNRQTTPVDSQSHELEGALRVMALGGPTAIIEYGGLRLLTDPTSDLPGAQPRGLVKLGEPVLSPDQLGQIDAVLLSHHHHPDNLDSSGRAWLPRAGVVISTVAGAEALDENAVGLDPWSALELQRPDGGVLTVTAVPAQHGPPGSGEVMGPVIGFVLSAAGLPSLYVSGDNAALDVVRQVVDRFGPVEYAILFAGGASLAARFRGAFLTLSSDDAAQAARVLGARAVIPLHFEGWAHFSQGADTLRRAFGAAGLSDRLRLLHPGEHVVV